MECEHVAQARPLKPINRLVVIADDKDIGFVRDVFVRREQLDQTVLRAVGVLEFINEDVHEAFLQVCKQPILFLERTNHMQDHVIVVVASRPLHHRLVLPEERDEIMEFFGRQEVFFMDFGPGLGFFGHLFIVEFCCILQIADRLPLFFDLTDPGENICCSRIRRFRIQDFHLGRIPINNCIHFTDLLKVRNLFPG